MRKTVLLYTANLKQLELLSDAQAGQLFRAILAYGQDGTQPELDPAASIAFAFMADQIDRSNAEYDAKCEARREAARLAGIASGKARRKHPAEEASEESERTLTLVNESQREEHKHKPKPEPNPKIDAATEEEKLLSEYARARAYANGQQAPYLPPGMSEEEAHERLRELFGRYFMPDPQSEGRLIEIMQATSLAATLKGILRAASHNAAHPMRYILAAAQSIHADDMAGNSTGWPEEPEAVPEGKKKHPRG